ncbi:MAG: ABC transporter ATP-binding protein [Bacilli bacterium]|nr:ABC transporter ATP-binding protein [Bacilli bacterium]
MKKKKEVTTKLDLERKIPNRILFKKLFKYLKPHLKFLFLALALVLISVICMLYIPLYYREAIQILSQDDMTFHAILMVVLKMAGLLLASSASGFIEAMTLQRMGQKIIYNVRYDVFRHIEYSSIEQINQVPIGKLVTRVTNDTSALNTLFTDVLVSIIKSVVTLIGVIVFMFICDAHLALYMLIMMPVIMIATFFFDMFSRKQYRLVRRHLSEVNAKLSENLSGMKITQVFNAEEKQYQDFRTSNEALRKANIKQIRMFGIFRPSIYLCYIATVIIVFLVGSTEALNAVGADKIVAISTILAFYIYIDYFFNPLQEIAEQLNTLQSALASSEKIFEILDTEPLIYDSEGAVVLNEVKGEIEFRHVWFAYEENNWILKDVSFHIKPREVVAFVGATGSGKTTILQLIVRNYDIQQGEILLDGINIKNINIASLRSKFGQMLQDVFLFSGNITDNIAMHEESITDQDVREACKYVGADTFIEKLPNKYQEVVRERGNNFSSGQRQLLSFARTVAHKPNIIILDEATANIDTETEVLIQASLEKMMNIGTMLMVAHRLSTIQHADKIIVLSGGVILEEGTHQELLKNKGHYYKLYCLQYEKKIIED